MDKLSKGSRLVIETGNMTITGVLLHDAEHPYDETLIVHDDETGEVISVYGWLADDISLEDN